MSLTSTQSTTLHLEMSHTRTLPSMDPVMKQLSLVGLNWTQVTAEQGERTVSFNP